MKTGTVRTGGQRSNHSHYGLFTLRRRIIASFGNPPSSSASPSSLPTSIAMGRQHTALVQRASPLAAKFPQSAQYGLHTAHSLIRYSSLTEITGIRPPQKAPHTSRNPYTNSPRARVQTPSSAARFLKSRALPTIREEPEEEEQACETSYDMYRQLDALTRDDERERRRHAQSSHDDDEMDWDEEKTLVAMLQDM